MIIAEKQAKFRNERWSKFWEEKKNSFQIALVPPRWFIVSKNLKKPMIEM